MDERKECPYKEKCYRKNPIHFKEMCHPHLEDLLLPQLDSDINIPSKLNFECSDRLQLLDQLKVLQGVLRQMKKDNKDLSRNCITSNKADENVFKAKLDADEELKKKIERNKQAANERRQQKLKELDEKILDATREKQTDGSNNVCIKRSLSPSNQVAIKKIKASTSDSTLSQNDISPANSSGPSSKRLSIGEQYILTKDKSIRKQMRDKAIIKMKMAGLNIPIFEPGEFPMKYALSAPYHYFLTKVTDCKETHDEMFSVTMPELLDESLGEIVNSLHINFMIDVGWLCSQYLLAAQDPTMTLLYGSRTDESLPTPPNITLINIEMPTQFGCHHSKISLFKYKDDGIRIIISTANLYSDDWENRTQGLWMSPYLPQLPESSNPSDGESRTGFKKDFRQYLTAYRHPSLIEWENVVKRADFSEVNVFFVGSVPGSHKGYNINNWGIRKLDTILSKHAMLPPDAPEWTIVAQSSSIGNLGPTVDNWISSNIVSSMSKEKQKGIKSNPTFKFIYPTVTNYIEGYDIKSGCSCFPYSKKSHEKQQWLKNYLYQWKSDKLHRTQAMPHIKSYTRISPDYTQIAWFVLTSANLSRGAWGTTAKTGLSHYIMNYEAGVVFLPQFIINQNSFPIENSNFPDIPVFRIPYDLPLTKYDSSDEPFTGDFFHEL